MLARPTTSRRAATVRARESDGVAGAPTREEGFMLGDDGGLTAPGVGVVVVETLGDEHEVCDAEVDG